MIKALLKFLVVLAVFNALYHSGAAFWRFYQLKDSAEQALIFGVDAKPDRIQEQIVTRAGDLELPVSAADVKVTKEGARSEATVSYRQEIELIPSVHYPYDFRFTVNAVAVR